ncbi:hypothetical protein P43SY_009197 [Pythium insidiosum]|uniref:Anoctamin transmembrane domain-containing protein n=1 Tax=Pythium insidiosum TaxID=114742 RepID=A0AAD5LRI7_PYTIN|nr:hypothetical protein P43SY_009197 [Pythium insidiosum]
MEPAKGAADEAVAEVGAPSYYALQSPGPANGLSNLTTDQVAVEIEASNDSDKPRLYEPDLVMIFPMRNGESKSDREFTVEAFVSLLMGKDQKKSKRRNKIVVDAFQRVFRTPRCYLDDQGREQLILREGDHSEQAEQERWASEERLLKEEYERVIGNSEPTDEKTFCRLVAKSVARRVQLACGLTTRMFESCDQDEIIMTLKADDNDLRVEADRSDYALQVSNKPFNNLVHKEKLEMVRAEIGDEMMQKARSHLLRVRGCSSKSPGTPEMDPLLMGDDGEEFHPSMKRALKIWGHTEEADGLFVSDESCRPDVGIVSWFGRIYHSFMEISYDPRTYFAPYADYRSEAIYQPFYRRYPIKWGEKKEETLFTQKDRIRLAASIVHRHINTDALVASEYLPLHKIRDYFGEKVALYFAWLGFYTKMLLFPTIAGIITYIVSEVRMSQNQNDGNTSNDNPGYILIAFAVVVVIWSSIFSELWKRKNHLFNALWGLHGFHRKLRYRAQFRGTKSYNAVTDAEEMTFEDRAKRRRAFTVSVIVVLLMISIVVVALIGIFYMKYWVNNPNHVDEEYKMPSTYGLTVANAIQILVLNMVYREVARKLNEYENHRTDREYENHLIIKVFLFQFCNSFASFFYIAFLKRPIENKCIEVDGKADNCLGELRSQLLILFLIRIIVGNTLEVVIPYLKYRWQLYKERDAVDKKEHNYIEEQAKLVPYGHDESFEDYNEMVIQFGFINLFVVAFPLTPLLAFANNMAEVHVDAVKLCYVHRRPFPYAAKSIGAWFYIMRTMSYIAVGTNTALILWPSDLFKGTDPNTKWLIFVVACGVCFMLSIFIERGVADMPAHLGSLMKRNEHIVAVVFRNMDTGDDSELRETAEDLDLEIYPNDKWSDGLDAQPLLSKKHGSPKQIASVS